MNKLSVIIIVLVLLSLCGVLPQGQVHATSVNPAGSASTTHNHTRINADDNPDTSSRSKLANSVPVLEIGGITSPVTAGSTSNITVTIKEGGVIKTDYAGTIRFSSNDPQASLPAEYSFTTGTGADNGVHTFVNGVTFRTAGFSRVVTATDVANTAIAGNSNAVTVDPKGFAYLDISGMTDPIATGSVSSITVTVKDEFGNVTGYDGTVAFSSTDTAAGVSLPPDYTFTASDNGTHSFANSVIFRTTGFQTVTATGTRPFSTITGRQYITVTGGASLSGKIAYHNAGIWIMNADGTHLAKIRHESDYYDHPIYTPLRWSADGNYLYYAYDPNAAEPGDEHDKIIKLNINTMQETFLMQLGLQDADPVISPDGAKIAFKKDGSPGVKGIYIMNPDGSNQVLVAPDNFDFGGGSYNCPTWSPDNSSLVIGGWGLWKVNANGTGLSRVPGSTGDGASIFDIGKRPSWSPDGSKIAFLADNNVWVTNTDFSNPVQLTSDNGTPDWYPIAWSPDNAKILYYTGAAPNPGYYAMDANGSSRVLVSNSGEYLSWGTGTLADPGVAVSFGFLAHTGWSWSNTYPANQVFETNIHALGAYKTTAYKYNGMIHFTSTDPRAVLPSDCVFTPHDSCSWWGGKIVNITLRSAGSQTFTVTDTVNPGITGTCPSIAITPGATSAFTITGSFSQLTAGVPFGITVTAKDACGNITTGYRGTVHFTASGTTLPADYTFTEADNGVHTFTDGVTFQTDGNQTVTVTDTANAALTGTSPPIMVYASGGGGGGGGSGISIGVPLSITSNPANGSADVTFGVKEDATTGFDTAYDDVVPPAPVADGIWVYFSYTDNTPTEANKLSASYIPPADELSWALKVVYFKTGPATGSVTIAWNAADIAAIPSQYVNILLRDAADTLTLADMRAVNFYTFSVNVPDADTTSVAKTFLVKISKTVTFNLDLKAGWNLVSLPVDPGTTDPAVILKDVGYYSIYTWDPVEKKYMKPVTEGMVAGKGYWVFVLSNVTQTVTGLPVNTFTFNAPVSGWYLIGSLCSNATFTANPAGNAYSKVYEWDAAGKSYTPPLTTIAAGTGNWFLALGACSVTVNPNP